MTTEAWIGLIGLALTVIGASVALSYRHGRLCGALAVNKQLVLELKERVIRLERCQDLVEQSLGEIRESIARIETLLTKQLK